MEAAHCERCALQQEKRRLRQSERYQTDPEFRDRQRQASSASYRRKPELAKAKAYLRLWRAGGIQNPNRALVAKYLEVTSEGFPSQEVEPALAPGPAPASPP